MAWQTVVELPEFVRRAKAIMSEAERDELVTFLAMNPEARHLAGRRIA